MITHSSLRDLTVLKRQMSVSPHPVKMEPPAQTFLLISPVLVNLVLLEIHASLISMIASVLSAVLTVSV